jgi:hypothetical protein
MMETSSHQLIHHFLENQLTEASLSLPETRQNERTLQGSQAIIFFVEERDSYAWFDRPT